MGQVAILLRRSRDLQRVLLHGFDRGPNGVAQRTHQHRNGHDEYGDPEQHQQGSGEPTPSTEMGRNAHLERAEGHREDQGPDRERQEGSQNAVAEQCHCEEKGGTNQHIEQAAREASFEVGVGCGERCQGLRPSCAALFRNQPAHHGPRPTPPPTPNLSRITMVMGLPQGGARPPLLEL